MTFNLLRPIKTVLCASIFGAQSLVVAFAGEKVDIFERYRQNIHGNQSGVYEDGDTVFFHDRRELNGAGRFAVARASQSAMADVAKRVFEWIDAHGGCVSNQMTQSISLMRSVGAAYANDETMMRRTLSGLPSRVLHRDADSDNPKEFVFDLAVRRDDLLAEARKGRFDTRREIVCAQWKRVVAARLAGQNRMAFVRDCGVFDLWTLESELSSGVVEVALTNGQEATCCLQCIDALKNCVIAVDSPAAREYGVFLEKFKKNVVAETSPEFVDCKTNKVGMMMFSYASSLCEPQQLPDSAFDVISRYAGQKESAQDTVVALISVLRTTPAEKDCWRIMGEGYLRKKCYHAAMSCFRNAIRLDRNDAEVYGLMATTYEKLGYGELAMGAAMIAYGLAKGDEMMPDVYRILGVKK